MWLIPTFVKLFKGQQANNKYIYMHFCMHIHA